ncbi:putative oxidoreductase YcjS [Maioricimonas rarisocia]|uniref:Putative oxidoreductase YcjS n=1 Tax=Maioricimonas rarisocia TaxID=2528026 RepID=A0A517Z2T9_9PLAN|nr:Gfo/Idh/MocA family oxidoreductase [Maioricimonas rarisocia]QDU36812.1 putative oxidoreductase YcjS [Maioricimonas rarisocia]
MADHLSTLPGPSTSLAVRTTRPRIGFLGVGRVGMARMQAVVRDALVREDLVDVVGICDPSPEAVDAAGEIVSAEVTGSLDELLELGLDGLVIATPTAQHAVQAQQALLRGAAVFCQQPLARNRRETERVIAAASEADRLLGVDVSCRVLDGALAMRKLVRSGELGEIYSIDLTFQRACGPNREWFYDPRKSGGGCVIDQGSHLVDFAGWVTGEWEFEDVRSTLWHRGQIMGTPCEIVEDSAIVEWRQSEGAVVRLACSWNLASDWESVIEAKFYGTEGTVVLRNVDGSCLDFVCERFRGTERERLGETTTAAESLYVHGGEDADIWGGSAVVNWARQLAAGSGFDPEIEQASAVAGLIDEIYRRPRED